MWRKRLDANNSKERPAIKHVISCTVAHVTTMRPECVAMVVGIIAGDVCPGASSLRQRRHAMTEPTFHPLTSNDLMDVLTLMGELYSHQPMRFDQEVAAAAVREALRDNSLGRIY